MDKRGRSIEISFASPPKKKQKLRLGAAKNRHSNRIFQRLTCKKPLLCKGLRGIPRFTGMAILPLQADSRCESVLRLG